MTQSGMDKINEPKKKRMGYTALGIILILIVGVFSSGCIFPEGGPGEETPTAVEVMDDLGYNLTIPLNVSTIISLAPAITEIIYAVEAQDMLIAVCDESDYPEGAKDKEAVAGWGGPDFERILFLAPDLIIASDMTTEQDVEKLRELGLLVLYLDPVNLDDLMEHIELIGKITRNADKAEDVVLDLDERIAAVTSKTLADGVNKSSVYIEFYPFWTYGSNSFGNDLITMAGGKNIGENGSDAYFEITNEEVIGANPKIIVYTVGSMGTTTKEDILARPGWGSIDAVKTDKIFTLPDDFISRPGPRMIDGLEELARIIHPELFPVR